MIVSHNEIITMVSKAYLGMKCKYGESTDIANMVADLQMVGLDGIRHFNNASQYLLTENSQPVEIISETTVHNELIDGFSKIDGRQNSSSLSITLDLHNNSVAYHLPAILDYAVERLDNFISVTLEIKNGHNRWLAFGPLSKLAIQGLTCIARWDNGTYPKHTLCVLNRGAIYPDLYFFDDKILTGTPQDMTIDIACEDFSIEDFISNCQAHMSSKLIVELNEKSWQSGIKVDSKEWYKLKQTAANLLVKNSEKSMHDAGGI